MRVLIAKAGTYSAREQLGDYDDWFRDMLANAGADSAVWHPQEEAPPDTHTDALLLTGSAASMTAIEPWITRMVDFVRARVEAGTPVLGVCFGHQLLAQAFGGRVERHPVAREVGHLTVELTDAGAKDPLFDGLPRTLPVNATHRDHVALLPAGATVLARNDFVPVQAFALGKVRGVQFHPEYSAAVMRAYAATRGELIDREAGPGSAERVARTACDTPQARRIVTNFVRNLVAE